MKFMMMMHTPKGSGDYAVSTWAPEDLKRHIAFMQEFNRELTASGEFVDGQGLAAPGTAKLVRAGKNGMPITDGPFAETKEFLAGYWIIQVPNAERAYELAARVSNAPGPRGAPLGMALEVREVLSAPPDVG